MPTTVAEKFTCEHCGKQFAWKPELAGKRAKCKGCGNVLTVPMTLSAPAASVAKAPANRVAAAPPAPPPAERALSDDDFGSYDFAGSDPPPTPVKPAIAVAAAPVATPVPTTRGRGGGGATAVPLAYRRQKTPEERRKEDRFSFWALLDVKRDIYAPIAILLVGFGSVIAWTMANIDAGALAIVIVSVGTAVVILVKTVVLTLGAIIIAPRFGLSFGDLRTAILKIAAIVVFTDGVTIWIPWSGLLSGFFFNGMIMGALCLYLFDMEHDETAMFAVPFAVASKITGFALMLVAAGIIFSLAGANSGGGGGGGGFGGSARGFRRPSPAMLPNSPNAPRPQMISGDEEDEEAPDHAAEVERLRSAIASEPPPAPAPTTAPASTAAPAQQQSPASQPPQQPQPPQKPGASPF